MAIRQGTPRPLTYSRADQMAGALGRHHQHVEVGAGLDQLEVDVEAVREHAAPRPAFMFGAELVLVEVGLQLVGDQDHDDVGPAARPRPASCT